MAERAEIVVVGAGVMGAATAHALRRAGREPVVLEQFELGHTRGSSHGRGRIFRLVYDDPHWVAQARRALPLWRELEAETGGLTGSGRPCYNAVAAARPAKPGIDGGRAAANPAED